MAEKMTALDPLQKKMPTRNKKKRIHAAELQKQEAQDQNIAMRQEASVGNTVEGKGGSEESKTVGVEDPNVVGSARTGYGFRNTF
ncbi:11 kDa late embryogenesis abundant -like [Olea europaea subsp. europaea]|uniref:11 kDa late embryogenesis abundant -like n=1 Tax=Olea europaea subsp. europaea TaxID=158383 RepID=A0A8S0TLV1_OLEEU|nr:11 kDa late embryogenesis abundant -like [Olea europaea subsp. europaea]